MKMIYRRQITFKKTSEAPAEALAFLVLSSCGRAFMSAHAVLCLGDGFWLVIVLAALAHFI